MQRTPARLQPSRSFVLVLLLAASAGLGAFQNGS